MITFLWWLFLSFFPSTVSYFRFSVLRFSDLISPILFSMKIHPTFNKKKIFLVNFLFRLRVILTSSPLWIWSFLTFPIHLCFTLTFPRFFSFFGLYLLSSYKKNWNLILFCLLSGFICFIVVKWHILSCSFIGSCPLCLHWLFSFILCCLTDQLQGEFKRWCWKIINNIRW